MILLNFANKFASLVKYSTIYGVQIVIVMMSHYIACKQPRILDTVRNESSVVDRGHMVTWTVLTQKNGVILLC